MPHLDMKLHLREQVCLFFERYLGFTTNAYIIKACHYLTRWRDERYPPAIIVKCLYFDEKTGCLAENYGLQENKHRVNTKPIIMKE